MHLHSDTDTYFGEARNSVARLHSGTIAGKLKGTMEATTPTGRRTSLTTTLLSHQAKQQAVTVCLKIAHQRKTGLSMFITIIHYFYLLEWPQQWGGIHRYSMFLEKPVSATVPISTPHGTKRPWQPPRFGQPADPASPWQRRPSPGLATRSQIRSRAKWNKTGYRNKNNKMKSKWNKSIRARRNMVRYCSCSNSKGTNRNRMSCVLKFSALRSDSSLNDRLASKYWPIWRLVFWC